MGCENCDKFESYEDPSVRVPDNCVTFMCNSGECPNKESIFNNFEAVCESPKKMSDYEEAQELLYMFYYSEEVSFSQEILDALILHLKEKIK